jgi:hypothetical protein
MFRLRESVHLQHEFLPLHNTTGVLFRVVSFGKQASKLLASV